MKNKKTAYNSRFAKAGFGAKMKHNCFNEI
jgi:hypothetical protein